MNIVETLPHAVRVIDNAWIPLADGARLAARLWLPEDAERHPAPAILEYIPYRKGDQTAYRDAVNHGYLAGHGYACVRVDMRGSGESDGVLPGRPAGQQEDDGAQVLRWIAAQPWCDGRVGMMGLSWGAAAALALAARRPAELGAALVVCPPGGATRYYKNGCLLAGNLGAMSILIAYHARPPDPAVVGEAWREKWRIRLDAAERAFADPAALMAGGSTVVGAFDDYRAIACPLYAMSGWCDTHPDIVLDLLGALDGPRKGLIGPWAHVYPHLGGPGPKLGFLQEVRRWFDHWLKDVDSGIMDEPMLRVWMPESAPPRPDDDERPGRWVAEPAWPSPTIAMRAYAVTAAGLAEAPGDDAHLTLRSPQTVGAASGMWMPYMAYGPAAELPGDQRIDDAGSLVFDSAPLAEPIEMLGIALATLEVAADRPRALVAVRLCDVAPDGASARVAWGMQALDNEPGERHRITVSMSATAHAFPAGHRIRLAVSTSYWPLVWPAPEAATLSLHTVASRLALPVRGSRADDDALRPFGPAEGARPPALTELRPAHHARKLSHDLATGEQVLTDIEEGGVFRLDASGLEIGAYASQTHRIAADDPAAASVALIWRWALRRGDWHTSVETRTEFRATADTLHIELAFEATEDGRPIRQRRWTHRVPREPT